MNKKFAIAVVVMFVAWMLEGFIVHGVILAPEYKNIPNLFRTDKDAESMLGFMLLAHLILAIGFVWIYAKGREAKPYFAQGLRYGLGIALVAMVPTYLIYYAIQPMPGQVVAMQIVLDTIGSMLMGVIVAWLYREPAAT
jgi:hypothetical protein